MAEHAHDNQTPPPMSMLLAGSFLPLQQHEHGDERQAELEHVEQPRAPRLP